MESDPVVEELMSQGKYQEIIAYLENKAPVDDSLSEENIVDPEIKALEAELGLEEVNVDENEVEDILREAQKEVESKVEEIKQEPIEPEIEELPVLLEEQPLDASISVLESIIHKNEQFDNLMQVQEEQNKMEYEDFLSRNIQRDRRKRVFPNLNHKTRRINQIEINIQPVEIKDFSFEMQKIPEISCDLPLDELELVESKQIRELDLTVIKPKMRTKQSKQSKIKVEIVKNKEKNVLKYAENWKEQSVLSIPQRSKRPFSKLTKTNIRRVTPLTKKASPTAEQSVIEAISSEDGEILEDIFDLPEISVKSESLTEIHRLHLFTRLESIILENNSLSTFNCTAELPFLQHLSLQFNKLESIPSTLHFLPSLSSLDLSHNQIKKISNLTSLPKLTSLNLRNNEISRIEQLNSLNSLKILDLSHNKVEIIENLTCLTELRVFKATDNKIVNTEGISSELKQIEDLSLSKNEIEVLIDLELPFLTDLYLSHNSLKDLNLTKCSSLREINASNNQIANIVLKAPQLVRADFSFNSINKLSTLIQIVANNPVEAALFEGNNIPEYFIVKHILSKLSLNLKALDVDQVGEDKNEYALDNKLFLLDMARRERDAVNSKFAVFPFSEKVKTAFNQGTIELSNSLSKGEKEVYLPSSNRLKTYLRFKQAKFKLILKNTIKRYLQNKQKSKKITLIQAVSRKILFRKHSRECYLLSKKDRIELLKIEVKNFVWRIRMKKQLERAKKAFEIEDATELIEFFGIAEEKQDGDEAFIKQLEDERETVSQVEMIKQSLKEDYLSKIDVLSRKSIETAPLKLPRQKEEKILRNQSQDTVKTSRMEVNALNKQNTLQRVGRPRLKPLTSKETANPVKMRRESAEDNLSEMGSVSSIGNIQRIGKRKLTPIIPRGQATNRAKFRQVSVGKEINDNISVSSVGKQSLQSVAVGGYK